MDIRYYAAYGSNLNIQQMTSRCPGAKIVGTAALQDHRLLCRDGQTGVYLTVELSPGHAVPLGIWSVTAAHEAILDDYERFPALYHKREYRLPVTDLNSGEIRDLDVFIYIMHETYPYGVPAQSYVTACLSGYRDFGFAPDVLHGAVAYSRSCIDSPRSQ